MRIIKTLLLIIIILLILTVFTAMDTLAEYEAYVEEHPIEVEYEPELEPELISLGEFKITYYCRENYPHICNNGDARHTATGTTPTPGRTIAVDPRKIPYGTEVIINGHTYIAEDCGGAIKENKIDILCDTHEEALSNGVDYYEVFIKSAM